MSNESLKSLHTALVDSGEGYAKAIEKSQDIKLSNHLRQAAALHAAAHGDIHRILAARGETVDDEGSFMGTVHKTVISARSAIVGLDEGSLDAFASGEDNNLEKYDEAIRDETDMGARQILQQHRDRLAGIAASMRQAA